MCFKPQRTSADGRIDTDVFPPSRFVAAAMHLPMVAATERYGKLIADLTAECP